MNPQSSYGSGTSDNATNTNDVATTSNYFQLIGVPICPDLLRYDELGVADNLRGRVIRGFFWLMRAWPC